MRRAVGLALSYVILLGCSAAPDAVEDAASDAAPQRIEDTGDPVDTEAPADTGAADTGVDVPRDAPRDAAMDVPRDTGFGSETGATRDAGVDAPRPDVVALDVPRDTGAPDVARDTGVDVPTTATCQQRLRALGVTFTVASATRGVEDPLMVTTPINGLHLHPVSYSNRDRPTLMDCRLALALHRLAGELRTRWNIDAIMHLGIYNYRVIAGTTTLSEHAHATAIDIASLRDTSGTTYTVETNFTANGRPTCPPRYTSTRDRVLKEIACWMYDSMTFNIILTPNYNAAHRDHFHVDLTAGSHYIGIAPPEGVDPPSGPWDFLMDDH